MTRGFQRIPTRHGTCSLSPHKHKCGVMILGGKKALGVPLEFGNTRKKGSLEFWELNLLMLRAEEGLASIP